MFSMAGKGSENANFSNANVANSSCNDLVKAIIKKGYLLGT